MIDDIKFLNPKMIFEMIDELFVGVVDDEGVEGGVGGGKGGIDFGKIFFAEGFDESSSVKYMG